MERQNKLMMKYSEPTLQRQNSIDKAQKKKDGFNEEISNLSSSRHKS